MRHRNILVRISAVLLVSGIAAAQVDEYHRLMNQGATLDRAGNYAEALVCFQDAIRIAEHQPDLKTLASAVNTTGMIYDELGRVADAMRHFRRALVLLERLEGKDTVDYAVVLSNLAADTIEVGDNRGAEKMLRESLATYATKVSPDDRRLAITRTVLAQVLMTGGHLREAESLLEEAVATLRKYPMWQNHLAISLNNLGVIRRLQKRSTEARQLFQEAVDMIERELGLNSPRLLQSLNNLALAYADAGRLNEADGVMRRALGVAEARLDPQHPSYGNLMLNYSLLLRKAGRKTEGKQFEARAKTIIQAAERRNGVGMTVDIASFRR